MARDTYGNVVIPAETLPHRHANLISGFRVGRIDEKPAGIDLHFEVDGQPHRITMKLGDALNLLSMLKAFQLNEDLPFPEDPRDPNWKPSDYKSKDEVR